MLKISSLPKKRYQQEHSLWQHLAGFLNCFQCGIEICGIEILLSLLLTPTFLWAEEKPYRTPLAGEAYSGTIFGKEIPLAARDRSVTGAFNALLFHTSPKVISPDPLPLGVFYYRKFWPHQRLRALFIGALDQVLYGRDLSPSWEGLLTFDNSTLPLAQGETLNRRQPDETEIYTGFLRAGVGAAWKGKVHPFGPDNLFSLGLLYEGAFVYFQDTSETADSYTLPPETYEHGLYLRGRINGFQRNILEMRHLGWALGADLILRRREKWRDHGFQKEEKESRTREYLTLRAYGLAALPLPFLSSRHRLLFTLYGGYSPGRLDRYSAMALGGASSADESEALTRPILWGALFEEYHTREYLVATAEYRYEILFFLYGHLRLSGGWMTFRSLASPFSVAYTHSPLGALSVGITSGFLWKSVLVLDYGYNWELKKNGKRGSHGVVLRWSISF